MMDDIERLYEHQTMMAVSIYSFLDNLLSALRTRPPSPPAPAVQMQPGGYSEDMFIYMSEKEKDEFQCSICYSILKNAHQCQNGHLFCYSCVYVWSHTPGGGHDRCPMCRADGLYAKNSDINDRLAKKRVKCSQEGCNWRGCLRDFDGHEHRRYDQSEISTGVELPSIVAAPKSVGVSTSDFLRSISNEGVGSGATSGAAPAPAAAPSRAANAGGGATRGTAGAAAASRRPSGSEAAPGAPQRRGTRRPDPLARRESTGLNTRPGMIPRPPTGPRPQNARPVRTGANTVARRGSNAPRPAANTAAATAVTATNPTSSSGDSAPPVPATEPPAASTATSNSASEPLAAAGDSVAAATSSSSPSSSATDAATSTTAAAAAAVAPDGDQTVVNGLEYRRLANPMPRPNPMTNRLAQGRDQLFILMTLMSYELEERRRAIEQFQSMTAERERVRLQQLSEVQTLNRRLTLVTNNLSRLLDSRVIPVQTSRAMAASQPLGLGRSILEDSSSDDSDDLFP